MYVRNVNFQFSLVLNGFTSDKVDAKSVVISAMGKVEEEDDLNSDGEYHDKDDGDDKVTEYWDSDHHKFEWSGYMQSLDSRSWHALGLGVPESFLSKGQQLMTLFAVAHYLQLQVL